MKKDENLEFKLIMKNIKKNRNIIENRIKTREEYKMKREEQNKKMNEIRQRNENNMKNKKMELYKRQMSRDLKDLHKRYQIFKPEYDENDYYYYNNKNKQPGMKINAFSGIHRHHVNQIKNNFYKKNEKLKFIQNNFLDININKTENKNYNINNYKKNKFNVPNNKKITENKGNKGNNHNFLKDDKLNQNIINNVCFDGDFFENNMIK